MAPQGANNMEIELRYKISSIDDTQKKLAELGARQIKETRVVDYWFVPNEISSQAEEDDWFEVKAECAMRIRDENGKASLGYKRMTKDRNHNTFLDADCGIESVEKGLELMKVLGRKNFLTVDKHRIKYELGEMEICIDTIKDYGIGLEIEYKREGEREEILGKIKDMATKLGISDEQRLEKSMTVEAMKALARF